MTQAEREQRIFAEARAAYGKAMALPALGVPPVHQRAIDAGIAAVRSLIEAGALREAADAAKHVPYGVYGPGDEVWRGWLRERADRLERNGCTCPETVHPVPGALEVNHDPECGAR